MYFAFIMAAINTLTVTYFLAIEKVPGLTAIFPTFAHYIIITISIGVPILVLIGYIHFKKTNAFSTETSIVIESNPFQRRMLVNTEAILTLNLQMQKIIVELLEKEKIDEHRMNEINKLKEELEKLMSERTFENGKDLEFLQKMGKK